MGIRLAVGYEAVINKNSANHLPGAAYMTL